MSTFTIKRRLFSDSKKKSQVDLETYAKALRGLNHQGIDEALALRDAYENEDTGLLATITSLGGNLRRQKARKSQYKDAYSRAEKEISAYNKGIGLGLGVGAGLGVGGGYLAGNYLTRNMDPEEDKNKIRAIKAASMVTGGLGGGLLGTYGGLKATSHRIGKSYKK